MLSETTRLAIVGLGTALVAGLTLLGALAWVLDRLGARRMARAERIIAAAAALGAAVELGCFLYGVLIEANRLDVQRIQVTTSKLKPGEKLLVAHISDLHVDRQSPALDKLVAAVREAKPDLVIFTGDSINSEAGVEVFRRTMRQLDAPLGRYAVKGNHDVWYWSDVDVFGGGAAVELDARIPLNVGPLQLCGARHGGSAVLHDCLRAADPGRVTLAAYHTPDLIEDPSPRPDLYLAGHTHGGQVRVPFYGAVITLAYHGKKYEMGRYEVQGTTLYVNRGIGFEPHAPRVRFLAPPELTLIELSAPP